MHSTALLTDHYELTMVQAALQSGTAFRHSVFELPWLEEQLAGRAAWGTREDELRRSDPLRDVALLGMRPSFTLDGAHTAVRAVEKVLMGEPDGD